MTTNKPTVIDLFRQSIKEKLEKASGLSNVFYGRSRDAGYPRISYTTTVWIQDSGLHGTLSCIVAGNTTASEVESIAYSLLNELEGFSFCSPDLMYYLHSGRDDETEDTDKTIHMRLVTFDFLAMGG